MCVGAHLNNRKKIGGSIMQGEFNDSILPNVRLVARKRRNYFSWLYWLAAPPTRLQMHH